MKSLLRSLLGIALFILLWQSIALVLQKSIIVPFPAETFKVMGSLLAKGMIWAAAGQTAWKVLLALVLVLFMGVLVGLVLGMIQPFYEMSRPVIMIIQAVPVISWLSLVLFTWGPSWQGPVLIAFLSVMPVAILTTVSGVKNLDQHLLEMARVYKVPFSKVLKDIYVGSLVPFVVAIIDVSIGQVWKVVLVAEYLVGKSGLGVEIINARYSVDISKVWAITLIAVALGIISERIIKLWLKRVTKKWQQA
jgi:NitT/TauT family transport system permease protein